MNVLIHSHLVFIIFIKFSTGKVLANSYKVSDIEISEPYNLNFSKEKVIDVAFKNAFEELIFTLLTSENYYLNKDVNIKLWNVEDGKRLAEKNKKFDQNFIELARNVYKFNDVRARIKSKINELSGSNIKEIKQHPKY